MRSFKAVLRVSGFSGRHSMAKQSGVLRRRHIRLPHTTFPASSSVHEYASIFVKVFRKLVVGSFFSCCHRSCPLTKNMSHGDASGHPG